MSTPTISEVRKQFPALKNDFAYLENAGGSQVPKVVADAVCNYMLTSNVQLGAGYKQSVKATETVAEAHNLASLLLNSGSGGETFLGPSTTALIHMVAKAYGQILKPGDEIIVAETNHEANAGIWCEMEQKGMKVKIWPMDHESFRCELPSLESLLTNRTKIVAMPHVSNLVGRQEEVVRACDLAHAAGAQVFVDGVAYAPHHPIDVQELGVDWYVFSIYKVYGPHMAALYGHSSVLEPLTGPNHGFIPRNSYPYKWEPGGISMEACAGFVALRQYLSFLAGQELSDRSAVRKAFRVMSDLERPVEAKLRNWVSSKKSLRMLGPATAEADSVGTVSFVHESRAANEISAAADGEGLGIRHGNMYAVRILDALGIPRDPGVVRVSAVHYNTEKEIDKLISVLDKVVSA